MLSFTPNDEQKMLVEAVNRFAQDEMRPAAHEADEQSQLPQAVIQKGWDIGLLPGGIPEAYGGFGEHSAVSNALAFEELAYGDLAMAMAILAPGLLGLPVHFSGTDEQKKNILPALAEAEAPLFTAAMIEPGVLFDPSALRTTAQRDGDYYTLNGAKCYVPMADHARRLLIYASEVETGNIEGFLVDAGTEGMQIGAREKLMGIRALPTFGLTLNQVRVSATCKLGGDSPTRYQRILSHSRVACAALAVGVARAAFEYARDYAKERTQFGAPVATKQSIAFMLAEMAIEIDAARMLTWEAAWKLDSDQGGDHTAPAYLAKEYAAKMAVQVADGAVQTLGGHGYIREHPVERWLRNARGIATFDGLAVV
jgi:alkylation response protein AidB-like acyl-CoA dehydrogenase